MKPFDFTLKPMIMIMMTKAILMAIVMIIKNKSMNKKNK